MAGTARTQDMTRPRRLPGDPDRARDLAAMVRVNQAGEYGAQRIYRGQRDVIGDRHAIGADIDHMAQQEDAHLEAFNSLMTERGVRPTALQPLWHVAGYALGAATALLGPRAAMACTVAVETEIDRHYTAQLERLGEDDPELAALVARFRAEELEHRDIALEREAEATPGYRLLSGAIRAGCRLAIRIAERV